MSAADKVAQTPHAPLAGRRVLLIEDEYFIADDMTHALTSLGAEIIGPISEIEEAQNIFKRGEAIDAAVLDINIRNEMIFPLARALRSRNVPFVFTTGYDKASLPADFQGVQLWEKPLQIPRVVRSLAEMLRERQS